MSFASALLTSLLLSFIKSLKMDMVPANYTGASFVPNLISQRTDSTNRGLRASLLNESSDGNYYGST
jgi:hypothetical protein